MFLFMHTWSCVCVCKVVSTCGGHRTTWLSLTLFYLFYLLLRQVLSPAWISSSGEAGRIVSPGNAVHSVSHICRYSWFSYCTFYKSNSQAFNCWRLLHRSQTSFDNDITGTENYVPISHMITVTKYPEQNVYLDNHMLCSHETYLTNKCMITLRY